MAGRITELVALTGAAADTVDLFEVVDVSDTTMAASGTNKRITLAELGTRFGGGPRTLVTYSATATTGALGDAGAYVRFTGTNPTYTVPPNSSVAFVVGTQIDGVGTATAMTLVAGAGVTLNRARTLVTVAADSGWSIIKVATNEWDCHGDFV